MQAIHKSIKSRNTKAKVAGTGLVKTNLIKASLISITGITTLSALLVLPLLSISSVSAADGFSYDVHVQPSLNISVSTDTVSLLLNPSNHPFGTGDLTITIGTNNPTGYNLYVEADSTDLANTAFAEPAYIETLESSSAESNFPAGYWGYQISDGGSDQSGIQSTTNFYPFSSGTLIDQSSTATNPVDTTLTFAAKTSYGKPAGLYSLDLNFKALPIVTIENMQNLTPSICTDEPKIVTDSRDGQVYTIQRLPWKQFDDNGNLVAEGTKCWMLDNLRLDISDPAVQARLSNQNTNASNETLGYLINGGGTSPYPANGVSKDWTSSDQNSYNLPYIAVSGDKDGGGTWDRNTVPSTVYGDASGKVGVYYNFCAASAGSYCYASGAAPENVNATEDVCPAGWSLPIGGATGEFQYLCNAYKGSACENPDTSTGALSMRNALSTPLSGFFNDGVAKRQGGYATFWSSTRYSGSSTYNLRVYSDSVYPQNGNGRYNGFSVRCVLTEPQS